MQVSRGSAAREEDGGAQLFQKVADPPIDSVVAAVEAGSKEGASDADEGGTESDGLCGVDARSDAAGGNEWQTERRGGYDRDGRWDAPVPEDLSEPFAAHVSLPGGAEALHPGEGRPANTAGVECSDASAGQSGSGVTGETGTGLFGDHREPDLLYELCDRAEYATCAAISLRLDGLLKEVEVDGDGVGADGVEEAADLVYG
jgi:hypothetical protein